MTEWILLAVALLLVAACGVFVAAEFSFITVERRLVEREAEAGDANAQGVLSALTSLSTQLSGAQLGITITNLAIGFLAEPSIATLIASPLEGVGVSEGAVTPIALGLAMALSTALTMIFGELVPKNLAIALPRRTAGAVQGLMRGFTAVTKPVITLLNGSANKALHRMGIEPTEELASARSPQELSFLVAHSAEQGTLDADTAQLVRRSLAFGERRANDVMTPRPQVAVVETDSTLNDVIDEIRENGHARFPVLDADSDKVAGVVTTRQVLQVPAEERGEALVRDVMRDAVMVPATMDLDSLLTVLRDGGQQMAVVIDEYGGFDGVVTLEDLVEEITGELDDEHDEPVQPKEVQAGTWEIAGLMRPDEAESVIGVLVPEGEEYETIGGLVMQEVNRLPEVGDRVQVEGRDQQGRRYDVQLEVAELEDLRVDTVRVTVGDPIDEDAKDGRSDHEPTVIEAPGAGRSGATAAARRTDQDGDGAPDDASDDAPEVNR